MIGAPQELINFVGDIRLASWILISFANLKEIAFEEVRDYVRYGSLTDIPYERADRFDTLVAIDVLEHIPERDVPRMVQEWVRLGIRKLVLLINLNQFSYPDCLDK